MILVPAFIYVLKLSEEKARATSTMTVLPMVVVSGIMYYRANYINWNVASLCAIGGFFGGITGAKLLMHLSDKVLKLIFICFLFYSSVRMIFF